MKNFLLRTVGLYFIISILLTNIGSKVSAQIITTYNYNCGVNNGLVWNGISCVNTCDQNHSWNPNLGRCSIDSDYYTYNNYSYNIYNSNPCNSSYYWTGTSCSQNPYIYTNNNSNNYQYTNYQNSSNFSSSCSAAYGSNFVWNGAYCVQTNNVSYCGNNSNLYWNGNSCIEKYVTQYYCSTNGQYYSNSNMCPQNNLNQYYNYTYSNMYNNDINYYPYNNNYCNCQYNYNNQYYQTNYQTKVDNEVLYKGYYDIYGNYHQMY